MQVAELTAKLTEGAVAADKSSHVDRHDQSTHAPTALPTAVPTEPELDESTAARREQVKKAMAWAWKGYVDCGWGFDDAQPISCDGYNFVSMGATIVDSLDGLWLMGLTAEFEQAAYSCMHACMQCLKHFLEVSFCFRQES